MEKRFKQMGLEVEVRKAKEMVKQAKIELKEIDLIKQYREERHYESITNHSDKRQWLDKVHQQRKDRSLTIGIQTIDFLAEEGIPVTYHNISEYSKAFDEKGKGIHQNTIKRNEELHSYYQKHSRTYKVKNTRKKPVMPTTFDEASLRRISSERDVKIAKKRYMQLSKEELVNRLIAVEKYVAENQERWVTNQFEQFK